MRSKFFHTPPSIPSITPHFSTHPPLVINEHSIRSPMPMHGRLCICLSMTRQKVSKSFCLDAETTLSVKCVEFVIPHIMTLNVSGLKSTSSCFIFTMHDKGTSLHYAGDFFIKTGSAHVLQTRFIQYALPYATQWIQTILIGSTFYESVFTL